MNKTENKTAATETTAGYEFYEGEPTWNGRPRYWVIERITDGIGTWNGEATLMTAADLDELREAGFTCTEIND